MNNFRTLLLAFAALLALPLSAFAHPGAAHQHSSAEVLIVGGVVLLVAVVFGVLSRRSAKPDAETKDSTQRGQ
jgi:nitrate reductase gamma subunit